MNIKTVFAISCDNFDKNKMLYTILKNKIFVSSQDTANTVYDKKNKTCKIENGASVTIFEIDKINLFKLYVDLIKTMGINCLWVDRGKFHGCITKMVGYKKFCQENNLEVKRCSMY